MVSCIAPYCSYQQSLLLSIPWVLSAVSAEQAGMVPCKRQEQEAEEEARKTSDIGPKNGRQPAAALPAPALRVAANAMVRAQPPKTIHLGPLQITGGVG